MAAVLHLPRLFWLIGHILIMNSTNNKTTENTNTTIDKLFAVGAHFGFTKRRRHPTVIPYLYGTKDGSDIIDLEQTSQQLHQVAQVVEEMASQGKTILYVGTKDEVAKQVQKAAEKVSAPYVVNRWIGGMLTNFSEIKRRIKRLSDLQSENLSGELERKYTKKERVMIGREMNKLTFNFGGIQTLNRVPDLMVVVDPRFNDIAVEEAKMIKIPVIGIMGSDSDVTNVTYPVVMNDALQGSVALALEVLTDAQQRGATKAASAAPASTSRHTTR